MFSSRHQAFIDDFCGIIPTCINVDAFFDDRVWSCAQGLSSLIATGLNLRLRCSWMRVRRAHLGARSIGRIRCGRYIGMACSVRLIFGQMGKLSESRWLALTLSQLKLKGCWSWLLDEFRCSRTERDDGPSSGIAVRLRGSGWEQLGLVRTLVLMHPSTFICTNPSELKPSRDRGTKQ